ncbi:MAG: MFS transporter [Pseudomonadota bacterium]
MQKRNVSIILANVLDQFDSNLYGFIAPIMAPLFFPKQEPIVQLILAYSFLATSSITRPIGVLIFGWLAAHYNPWSVLRITLMGVGLSTFLMGCIPTFSSVGYYSAFILLWVRIVGGVFAQGERTIASIYILEDQSNKYPVRTNAWFESSVIVGSAMASWTANYVSEYTWRIPFWCGGVLALYAVFLRYSQSVIRGEGVAREDIKTTEFGNKTGSLGNTIANGCSVSGRSLSKDDRPSLRSFLLVVFAGGLYYVTYDLSFVLLNTFAPLITNISRETMMYWNTTLLLFDMFLFVPLAYVIRHRHIATIKKLSVIMLALPSIPFFYFMQDASLFYVLFVRFWIVFWGVVFSCVLNVHLLQLFPHKHKYLWLGLGGAAGSALIGRSTSALCLWGWHETHFAAVPGVYLCVVAMMVWLFSRKI